MNKRQKNNTSSANAAAGLGCAVALTCASSMSFAAAVTNNVIYGDGTNSNTDWTVSTSNNIEVGLRAKQRGANVYNWDGTKTYTQQAGNDAGNALWNFDYSVNLRQDGTGVLNWDSVAVILEVDKDPTAAVDYSIYPSVIFVGSNSYGDNSTGAGAGQEVGRFLGSPNAFDSNWYLMQNSYNVSFFPIDPDPFPFGSAIDPDANGIYDFRLSVYGLEPGCTERDLAHAAHGIFPLLAQTEMQVRTVPIPAAAWLFGSALVGLAGIARRRKTT